jgi:hypothetical protein
MYNFGFQGYVVSNTEGFPAFWQTMHSPSPGWMGVYWRIQEALYKQTSGDYKNIT